MPLAASNDCKLKEAACADIHEPENKSVYVLSRDGGYPSDDTLMWTQFCTTVQGRHAAITADSDAHYFGTRTAVGSRSGEFHPPKQGTFGEAGLDFGPGDHGLFASRAEIRYSVPLLLGRRDTMAFALMFPEPEQLAEGSGVVLCHGMGGGGFWDDRSDRHPAWDFLLYTRDPIANPEGEFKGRILYKQFEGRPDILREYQCFQSEVLGRQWVIPPHAPLENDMDPGFVAQPRL